MLTRHVQITEYKYLNHHIENNKIHGQSCSFLRNNLSRSNDDMISFNPSNAEATFVQCNPVMSLLIGKVSLITNT